MQASLVVSAWRLFISFLSSVALLKLPRRPLFLSTTLLVCLSMASLGVFSYFQVTLKLKKAKILIFNFIFKSHPHYAEYVADLRWAPLVLVLMIYAGAQMGFNPIIKVSINYYIIKTHYIPHECKFHN